MLEVKQDALEASFEALERQDEEVAQLRGEMAQLKARVDAQALAAARPALSGATARAAASPFVDTYLRKGVESGVELKAVTGVSDAAGGYAIPEETDAAIGRALIAASPIRRLANVVRVGTSGYRRLVSIGAPQSGWVAETAPRPETATPEFAELAPPMGELYANRRPARRCSTTPPSTSRNGWPARSPPSSPAPKGRRSSPATASPSRAASSTRRRRRRRTGCGGRASSSSSRPGRPAASRARRRRTG
jgi:predicted phage gp36 major capsid-like protein